MFFNIFIKKTFSPTAKANNTQAFNDAPTGPRDRLLMMMKSFFVFEEGVSAAVAVPPPQVLSSSSLSPILGNR
ncbi:hypothetical protein L202_01870 [Cryptococcus amylolentus CBS 6039]|uniref:Uncharacterized protein n=1 Tax=Cryptococcus amylolentus CBS 6039 TaxID=1295533 RepID=A0A1E3HYM9_9TREE|nr:hypothetical protein L202_01870 [Cryptococcus amylolentus CBS 6039]ODN81440.1 hypothetical protein L202_01870 [Cryptococcus amylolentus CBS 6039]